MKLVHDINLIIHITCGFTALVTGIVPMVAKKGGRRHVFWGKVYFWSMFGVFLTAVVSFIQEPKRPFIQFLFFIAIFSFHLTLSGVRAIRLKKAANHPERFDEIIAYMAMAFGLIMLGFGLWGIVMGSTNSREFSFLSILYVVFGTFMLRNGWIDSRLCSGKTEWAKMHWFFHHLTRMVAAYIATFTAFCVVNIHFLPPLVVWLAPGLIGGLGITRWVVYYRARLSSTRRT